MSFFQESGYHFDLLLYVVGRLWLDLGRQHIESLAVTMEDLRPMFGHFRKRFSFLSRPFDCLVVDVGEIANMEGVVTGHL